MVHVNCSLSLLLSKQKVSFKHTMIFYQNCRRYLHNECSVWLIKILIVNYYLYHLAQKFASGLYVKTLNELFLLYKFYCLYYEMKNFLNFISIIFTRSILYTIEAHLPHNVQFVIDFIIQCALVIILRFVMKLFGLSFHIHEIHLQ